MPGGRTIKVIPSDGNGTKKSFYFLGAIRVMFFPWQSAIVRQISRAFFQQILQQLASVFEQCFPKPKFDGFQIADAGPLPSLTDQP